MNADLVQKLGDLGLSLKQVTGVLALIEERDAVHAAKEDERKAQIRARVQKCRAKNKPETLRNVTDGYGNGVKPLTRVEGSSNNLDITGEEETKKQKTARGDLEDFQSELSSILDADRVQAMVDVRRQKGGKINGHAARLLIGKIQTCGLSPQDAADTMALRHWISIEAAWVAKNLPQSTPQQRGTGPPRERSVSDVLGEIAAGTWNGPQGTTHEPEPFIEASFSRRN